MLDLNAWLLMLTIIAHFGLGTLVISNRPRAFLNRLIFSFTLFLAAWAFSVLMIITQTDYGLILTWIRFSFVVAILIIWHIYALAVSFPEGGPFESSFDKVVFIICLLFSFLSGTPLLIQGIIEPYANREPLFGLLFIPYYLLYGGLALYALIRLFRRMRSSRGLLRMQLRYLFGGILFSVICSSLANLFLPLFNINELAGLDVRPLGPVFPVAMVGTVSYAIVRYHFMDIRFAFRKNLSLFFSALAYIILIIIGTRIISLASLNYSIINLELLLIIVVILVMLTLPYINQFIERRILEKYIFKKPYDYRTSLIHKIEGLTTVLDYERLIATFVTMVVDDMGLEQGFYYCRVSNKVLYYTDYSGAEENDEEEVFPTALLSQNGILLKYMEDYHNILIQADLKQSRHNVYRGLLEKEMQDIKTDVIVPMLTGSELEGLLFLGSKQSGEPYFKEDVQLLSILASQVTAVFKNARLYHDLLDTKQYLERIIISMGNGLITIGEDGIISVFNDEAEKITGIKAVDALGNTANSILASELYSLYRDTLRNGKNYHEVERVLKINGAKRYLSCDTSLIEFVETGNREVILVLSNISRIKELEEEKSKAQRLATLGEMVAGIAHEIKNPLVSIKTFAELLPEKYDDEQFRHGYSEVVGQEITRINNLITEMLNYVKNNDLYLESVNLRKLLDDLILLLTPQLEDTGIFVYRDFSGCPVEIKVDRNLIKQALLNICVNAIQVMPGGGSLSFSARMVDDRTASDSDRDVVEFQAADGEGFCEILIEDSGPGIETSIRDSILDPFVTSKPDGVGLGLSVSHKIISAHGGKITYYSGSERGTVFKITLPLLR